MTMTEPMRRAGKPSLLKQPEIEEVEESHTSTSEPNGSPNSDVSDATITATEASACIPVCIQSASDSPENGSPEDSVPVVKVEYPESRKGSLKLKLTRGEAVRDDASPPPPDVIDESYVYEPPTGYDTLLLPNKLEKQGSQGSDTSTSPCLSRDSSIDSNYKDSTGIDLVEFIRKTLNKSVKDKKMLLQLEKDFKKFIREPNHQYLQLPEMSSYDRMVVHRIAAFFGLDHNVDQRGKSVIVSKTKKTRVPDLVFEDYVTKGGESQPKRQILPRKAPSMDEKESKGLKKPNLSDTRAKSLEERQRSYDEHKARIFNGEDELQQQQQQQQHTIALRSSKCSLLSSKDDLTTQPWSSTDSSGYNTDTSAPTRGRLLPKANSYSGRHTVKSAESLTSHSGSFDSSVLRPPNAVPTPPSYYGDISPTSSAGPMQLPIQSGPSLPLIIAPPDVRSIPPGSVMIDPHTMLPYRNPDGTYYHYDPKQPPPPWLLGATQQQTTPHHVHSQPTAVPFAQVVRQASVESVGEVCQKFNPLTITPHLPGGDSVEVTPLGTPQPTHPPTIIMGSQQPYPPSVPHPQPQLQHNPQPTIQPSHPPPPLPNVASPYYPSPGMAGQQPVRYVYPMAYGQSECHNHVSPAPLVGQYPQQYVPSYPTYQNIVHQGTPQTTEMAPATYQPTSVYPVSHTDNMSSYSIQYTPHSQQTYGQHSPVYYSIPQTASPQMAFSYTGQNSIRAATPPSQPSASIPNSNLAINVGQTFPYTQQGAPTPGTTYTSYQPYPPLQFSHQPRPVNQVVQFQGIQSQTPPQGISVLRPGIPINMQPSSMAPNNIGQTLSAKGYQMTGCVQKSSVDKDGNVTLISTPNAGISAPPPHIFQHIPCANPGMIGPTPVRPQIQHLQFTTSKPQSTQSQVPKTRPVIPSVVSIRNPRPRKLSSNDSEQFSISGSSSSESASNQNA